MSEPVINFALGTMAYLVIGLLSGIFREWTWAHMGDRAACGTLARTFGLFTFPRTVYYRYLYGKVTAGPTVLERIGGQKYLMLITLFWPFAGFTSLIFLIAGTLEAAPVMISRLRQGKPLKPQAS